MLPPLLVTLQRHAKAKGYFSPERFSARIEDIATHELAGIPTASPGTPTSRFFPPSVSGPCFPKTTYNGFASVMA